MALPIEGVRDVEVKPFGPDQAYVALATFAVLKLSVEPAQTGLLLVGAGVAGVDFTVTVATAVFEQPDVDPVTVYDVVEDGETVIGFDVDPVLQE